MFNYQITQSDQKNRFVNKQILQIILFFCVFICCLSVGYTSNQTDILKKKIFFNFNSNIVTVHDAVDSILENYGYKLQEIDTQGEYAQAMLSQKLTSSQRRLVDTSLFAALITLVGDDFEIIIKDKEISFKLKEVVFNRLKKDKATSGSSLPIKQFLLNSHYQIRLAQPLIKTGLYTTKEQELIKYAQNHEIYFSFNDKDQIVAIGQTKQEANALSLKTPKVFFAKAGDTVKQTITNWAKLVNLQTYYLAQKDLIIEASGTFYGDFGSEKGVLTQLLESLAQSGVDLKAEFNSNNVLLIKDNSYSPILLGGNYD